MVFVRGVEEFAEARLKRLHSHKKIRHSLYLIWYIQLQENNIGTDRTEPNYAWPPVVLDYIRILLPEDTKCEIFENSFQVDLENFLCSMDIPKIF